MDKVTIYTDGACSSNPGPTGGLGCRCNSESNQKKLGQKIQPITLWG